MAIAPIAKPRLVLNIDASTSNPFVLTPLAVSIMDIIYIPTMQMAKTKPILSKNGISYKRVTLSLCNVSLEKPYGDKNSKLMNLGANLKKTENIKPPTVANRAAFEVAFFQKKPRINMANMPG